MMDAEVRMEESKIDLLVLSEENKWIFVIENKIEKSQGKDQLQGYLDYVNKNLIDGEIYRYGRGIFLTLREEPPNDPRYAPILHRDIGELIKNLQEQYKSLLSTDVNTFIGQYLEVIEEINGMNTEQEEMEKLARKLYLDHSRALEFIFEHGKRTGFPLAVQTIFGERTESHQVVIIDEQKFAFIHKDSRTVRFLPKDWFNGFGGEWNIDIANANVWKGKFPLIVGLELIERKEREPRIGLFAAVGPLSNNELRISIIDEITRIASERGLRKVKFQARATDEGRESSRFLQKSRLIQNVHDHESIIGIMKKLVGEFQREFDAVAQIIPQFREHGERDEEST